MNKQKIQVIIFIIYSICNFILYFLSFPNWIFLLLACFFVLTYQYYEKEKFESLSKSQNIKIKTQQEKLSCNDSYIKEVEIARNVQEALLSFANPEIPGINIEKKCLSAKHIGGDFYTFINKEQRVFTQKKKIEGVIEYVDSRESYLGIAIGDVAGHGVSSALVMALTSGLFGEIGKYTRSTSEALKTINENLAKYLAASHISHVTAFYCLLNTITKKLHYSKAGHPPALLIHKDGIIENLDSKGVLLGIYKNDEFEEKEVQLVSKDKLILYTDGILEARNKANDTFGLDRFKDFLHKNMNKSIQEIKTLLFEEIIKFSGTTEASDDQTLVIIEIE
jgi:phosphoserine phosphatase RsbU/P